MIKLHILLCTLLCVSSYTAWAAEVVLTIKPPICVVSKPEVENQLTPNGITPLMIAAFEDDVPAIELLLKQKADVNAESHYKFTALGRAFKAGTAAFLLDHGANIDYQGSGGLTVLHAAILAGRVEKAVCLLQRNANPFIQDVYGFNAFDFFKAFVNKNFDHKDKDKKRELDALKVLLVERVEQEKAKLNFE